MAACDSEWIFRKAIMLCEMWGQHKLLIKHVKPPVCSFQGKNIAGYLELLWVWGPRDRAKRTGVMNIKVESGTGTFSFFHIMSLERVLVSHLAWAVQETVWKWFGLQCGEKGDKRARIWANVRFQKCLYSNQPPAVTVTPSMSGTARRSISTSGISKESGSALYFIPLWSPYAFDAD